MLADPFPPNGGAPVLSVPAVTPAETSAPAADLPVARKDPVKRENLQQAGALPINRKGNVSKTEEKGPDTYLDSDGEVGLDGTDESVGRSDLIEGWTYSENIQDKGRTWTHAEDRFLWQIYRRYNEDELADIAKLLPKTTFAQVKAHRARCLKGRPRGQRGYKLDMMARYNCLRACPRLKRLRCPSKRGTFWIPRGTRADTPVVLSPARPSSDVDVCELGCNTCHRNSLMFVDGWVRGSRPGPHLLPGSNTFCMCGTNTGGFMLECNGISSSYTPTDSDKARNRLCNGWIHPKCMGLSKEHIDKIEHVESFSCPWCASHERRMGKNRKQTGASAFRAPTLDIQEAFAKVSTQVPPDVLDEVASALTAITFAVAEENSSLGVFQCHNCGSLQRHHIHLPEKEQKKYLIDMREAQKLLAKPSKRRRSVAKTNEAVASTSVSELSPATQAIKKKRGKNGVDQRLWPARKRKRGVGKGDSSKGKHPPPAKRTKKSGNSKNSRAAKSKPVALSDAVRVPEEEVSPRDPRQCLLCLQTHLRTNLTPELACSLCERLDITPSEMFKQICDEDEVLPEQAWTGRSSFSLQNVKIWMSKGKVNKGGANEQPASKNKISRKNLNAAGYYSSGTDDVIATQVAPWYNRHLVSGLPAALVQTGKAMAGSLSLSQPLLSTTSLEQSQEEQRLVELGEMWAFRPTMNKRSSSKAPQSLLWVHERCLEYAPQAYIDQNGVWQNVRSEVQRGRQIKCSACGWFGATIVCANSRCSRVFHFTCASKCDWRPENKRDRRFYCDTHRPAVKVVAVSSSGNRSKNAKNARKKTAHLEILKRRTLQRLRQNFLQTIPSSGTELNSPMDEVWHLVEGVGTSVSSVQWQNVFRRVFEPLLRAGDGTSSHAGVELAQKVALTAQKLGQATAMEERLLSCVGSEGKVRRDSPSLKFWTELNRLQFPASAATCAQLLFALARYNAPVAADTSTAADALSQSNDDAALQLMPHISDATRWWAEASEQARLFVKHWERVVVQKGMTCRSKTKELENFIENMTEKYNARVAEENKEAEEAAAALAAAEAKAKAKSKSKKASAKTDLIIKLKKPKPRRKRKESSKSMLRKSDEARRELCRCRKEGDDMSRAEVIVKHFSDFKNLMTFWLGNTLFKDDVTNGLIRFRLKRWNDELQAALAKCSTLLLGPVGETKVIAEAVALTSEIKPSLGSESTAEAIVSMAETEAERKYSSESETPLRLLRRFTLWKAMLTLLLQTFVRKLAPVAGEPPTGVPKPSPPFRADTTPNEAFRAHVNQQLQHLCGLCEQGIDRIRSLKVLQSLSPRTCRDDSGVVHAQPRSTICFYSSLVLKHMPPLGHVESPERVRSVLTGLREVVAQVADAGDDGYHELVASPEQRSQTELQQMTAAEVAAHMKLVRSSSRQSKPVVTFSFNTANGAKAIPGQNGSTPSGAKASNSGSKRPKRKKGTRALVIHELRESDFVATQKAAQVLAVPGKSRGCAHEPGGLEDRIATELLMTHSGSYLQRLCFLAGRCEQQNGVQQSLARARVAIVPHLDRASKSLESRKRIGRPMQCERWPACHDHTFDEGCAAPAATKEEQAVLAAAVAATTSNPDTAPLPVEQGAGGDTFIGPLTLAAALRACTVVCKAVDAVVSAREHWDARNAFCIVRPPGHHVGRAGCTYSCCSQGFCLLNNVAVGITHARLHWGLRYIAVVDIDVHFGNGTADILDGDKDAFFSSIHCGDLFPGPYISAESDTSNFVSCFVKPIPPREKLKGKSKHRQVYEEKVGPAGFRRALQTRIIPAMRRFDPELIFISAGFDGHKDDILNVGIGLTEKDYMWAAQLIVQEAERPGARCHGRVVSVLEGGYDVAPATRALSRAVSAHVRGLFAPPT